MSDIVIKVENLSKQYRLGEIGRAALKDDMKRWRYKMMGREDPFLTIGEVNDRTITTKLNYVWALKNINFDIKSGDIVGIIGRNGAGKSTLLKLLSRTTGPTTGSLKMKGRIASLLEVGTGFHPELSGRENIYLNGAILGMRKAEITKKFDEIVSFSGVERYIDTPVKRYSSGMYVRLAFGVAAHLESEILIVDEVLAVGDAEFQKKCLGKMGEVSKGEGRTVLFVSHNMAAIKTLCKNGMYLKNGNLIFTGTADETIKNYLTDSIGQTEKKLTERTDRIGNESLKVTDITFRNFENIPTTEIMAGDYLKIDIEFEKNTNLDLTKLIIGCGFSDAMEIPVVSWISDEMNQDFGQIRGNVFSIEIPSFNLRPNTYNFNFQISYNDTAIDNFCDSMMAAASINVLGSDFFKSSRDIRPGSSLLLDGKFLTS